MYSVTIKREKRGKSDLWVARDESGTRRSWCDAKHANTASGGAMAMFHGDELANVRQDGETATAWVMER